MKVLALDLGGSSIKAALIDEQGRILRKTLYLLPESVYGTDVHELARPEDQILPEIKTAQEFAREVLRIHQESFCEAEGIAISYCCPVDGESGITFYGGSAYTYLNNLNFYELMSSVTQIPVVVEKDSNCLLCAEIFLGGLQNVTNAVALGFGTAIACGLLINGSIVRGAHFMAGEASGMLVGNMDLSGWDAIWSNHNGAAALIGEVAQNGNKGDPVPMDGYTVFELVTNGNANAVQALERFCKIAIRQIYNLQLLLDPEVFIISGGIGQEITLVEMLRREIDALYYSMDAHIRPVIVPKLCLSTFGNDANLIGASCLLFKQLGVEMKPADKQMEIAK